MMIIFQNKIIYMPSMPPFSRSEKLEDYVNTCKPVVWTEHSIESGDGTALKLLEGTIPPPMTEDADVRQHVVIVYFQGNASSLPPRLPHLSSILKLLQMSSNETTNNTTKYTLVALSYRGFWKSKGSANQKGIELDAQATLKWISDHYASQSTFPDNATAQLPTKVILWGQSIGAGVATTALATWSQSTHTSKTSSTEATQPQTQKLPVSGLLLETPFTSLKAMLIELYPQKFLPYRYLGPFLMSTWDSTAALSEIGGLLTELQKQLVRADRNSGDLDSKTAVKSTDTTDNDTGKISTAASNPTKKDSPPTDHISTPPLHILLLEAENDELVPKADARTLFTLCTENYRDVIKSEHKVVTGALHTDVMMKAEGKREIVKFLRRFGNSM